MSQQDEDWRRALTEKIDAQFLQQTQREEDWRRAVTERIDAEFLEQRQFRDSVMTFIHTYNQPSYQVTYRI